MVRLSEVLCGCQPRERRPYSDTPWSLHLSSFGGGVSVLAIYRELPPAVGALLARWLANRAALEAMDQPFPPRPALFLRLMLMTKPSGL
jgi:hypothetical protein